MNSAISQNTAQLVLRLLDEGLSQCEIARSLRLSPASVSRIAAGQFHGRGLPSPRHRGAWSGDGGKVVERPPVGITLATAAAADLPEISPENFQRNSPPVARRCAACGGRVLRWPCLACEIRGIRRRDDALSAESPSLANSLAKPHRRAA